MSGTTVTRAQLTEAVYQEVGLSRNESAELVESVIAEISDAPFFERIELQHRIPGTDHGRLHANVARPKASARAISRASIERDTNQRQVQFRRLRNMGQAHECGHTRKARINQRVHRHRMRLHGFL